MISTDELENEVKKKWPARGVVRRHIGLTTRKLYGSSPAPIDGSLRTAQAFHRVAHAPDPTLLKFTVVVKALLCLAR